LAEVLVQLTKQANIVSREPGQPGCRQTNASLLLRRPALPSPCPLLLSPRSNCCAALHHLACCCAPTLPAAASPHLSAVVLPHRLACYAAPSACCCAASPGYCFATPTLPACWCAPPACCTALSACCCHPVLAVALPRTTLPVVVPHLTCSCAASLCLLLSFPLKAYLLVKTYF
jgi:hypothetical protein